MTVNLRSSLRQQPRKTYTNDAFDGVDGLQPQDTPLTVGDDDADGDFDNADVDADVDDNVDEDFLEGDDSSITKDASRTNAATKPARQKNPSKGANKGGSSRGKSAKATPRRQQNRGSQAPEFCDRGLNFCLRRNLAKEARRCYLFGPDAVDYLPPYKATHKWAYDSCLPQREEQEDGSGGYEYGPTYSSMLENEAVNWIWWSAHEPGRNGGEHIFRLHQKLTEIVADNIKIEYCAPSREATRAFLMGPIDEQKLFVLEAGRSISLTDAFTHDGRSRAQDATPSYKAGFVINLGARVHNIEWVPNQPGEKQYLTVSVLPQRSADGPTPLQNPSAPAFVPQHSHKSTIQIWEFMATAQGNYLDKARDPQLKLALCTQFGDIKAFKWCPVPWVNHHDQLGLLAFIAGDGALRVLHVETPRADYTIYNRVDEVAFVAKPPDTVCTSVTWISASRLAASCANGFIAVWDLSRSGPGPSSTNGHRSGIVTRPLIYTSIHPTFILTIVSCFPTYPDIVFTSCMSGYVTFTNLASPISPSSSPATTAYAPRNRVGQAPLCWHDMGRLGLSPDDARVIKMFSLRRIYGTPGALRVKSQAYAIAASLAHPSYLVATAHGDVVASNPLRRLISGGKAELWALTWFAHEWRRPERDETQLTLAMTPCYGTESYHEPNFYQEVIVKHGLSRMTEGYRPTKTILQAAAFNKSMKTNEKRHGPGSDHDGEPDDVAMEDGDEDVGSEKKEPPRSEKEYVQGDSNSWSTTHEEWSAVTAVTWNPNRHVAGWAAAGMADGLLRVEDIGL